MLRSDQHAQTKHFFLGQSTSPEPLSHRSTRQFIGNLTLSTFRRGVACNILARMGLEPVSSTWWDFRNVPNFEANVRRRNPSANTNTTRETTQNVRKIPSSPSPTLNREGRRGNTDDVTTCFLHFSLFSTAIWDLANSKPVHSLMLSSHLFLCLPYPLSLCLARYFGWTWWTDSMPIPHHFASPFMVRPSYGPIACWILARTSSLVTWSLYAMRSTCI